ncbi:MAG TPA: hypothetical protein VF618_16885 [Thermoanaerobaculia bacterium]
MPRPPEDEVKSALDAGDDYRSTVNAMLAFSAFVVHDGTSPREKSHFGFGRRMTTSSANIVAASGDITPDLVAQKSDSYGVVAEVKRSLPLDRTRWIVPLKQLRKYDDELTGWWTENERIAEADATLLLHQTRSRAFIGVLEAERAKDAEAVGAHTSVIEFSQSNERQQNYFFRLEWGGIRDNDLSARLKDGVSIPIMRVLSTFPNVIFYDADPPTAWFVAFLWIDYFTALAAGGEYDANLKAVPVDVNAAVIADELQKAYGSQLLERDMRSVEFPSVRVVRRALDALVAIKLAMALPKGEYRILYRQIKDDVYQRFASMMKTPAEKVTAQAELPFRDEPESIPSAPDPAAKRDKTAKPKGATAKPPQPKRTAPKAKSKSSKKR